MDADRETLIAERNRAQQRLADAASDYERQLTETVSKVRSELTQEIEKLQRELEEARRTATLAQVPASTEVSPDGNQVIQAEVARVETSIQEISKIVEDSQTELSIVIRKNVERAELQSYLRGLRFNFSRK